MTELVKIVPGVSKSVGGLLVRGPRGFRGKALVCVCWLGDGDSGSLPEDKGGTPLFFPCVKWLC